MDTNPRAKTDRKLPTPWLADSEWLLEELAKTREAVLRIRQRLDNASDIKSVIDRIWNLERTLGDLLRMHRAGQRAFAQRVEEGQNRAAKRAHRKARKIVRIQSAMEHDFATFQKRSIRSGR